MPNQTQNTHPAADDHYDYIISGTGAAGLSLVARMISSGRFSDKQILLVDKEPKIINDRTWCFWENEPGYFESIVYKSWPAIWIHGTGYSRLFEIKPYHYKMIRGIDFYNHCLALIAAQPNITTIYGNVQMAKSDERETFLLLNGKKYTADLIFNSILFQKPAITKNEFYLIQHFKGWYIETPKPAFNTEEATLMDFRVSQKKGTAFVYVMPLSAEKALVEYTMFSKKVLDQAEYDACLRTYIDDHLKLVDYKVTAEEYGEIPMTNYRFPAGEHNLINIGTAGGQTKASSGYTFAAIQKSTAAIVAHLVGGVRLHRKISAKYYFYDSVLLNVLATGKLGGDTVFTQFFRKNRPQNIFQFLDNDSSLLQDLKLISSLPTIPFLRAGIEELFT